MKQPVQSHTVFSIALESDDEYETLFSDDNEMYDVLTDMPGVDWAMMEDGCILFGVPEHLDAKAVSGRVFRNLQALKRRTLEEAPEGLDRLPDPVIEAAKKEGWDAQLVFAWLCDFIHDGGADAYRASRPFNAEGHVLLGALQGYASKDLVREIDFSEVLQSNMSEAGWDVGRLIDATVEFLESDAGVGLQGDWIEGPYAQFLEAELGREEAHAANPAM